MADQINPISLLAKLAGSKALKSNDAAYQTIQSLINIIASNITSSSLEESQLGIWSNYTPVLSTNGTAPSLGNGALIGRFVTIGTLTQFFAQLTVGSTTTLGTGTLRFSLPATHSQAFVGNGLGITAAFAFYPALTSLSGTNSVALITTAIPGTVFTSTNPVTWSTGDIIRVSGFYESN